MISMMNRFCIMHTGMIWRLKAGVVFLAVLVACNAPAYPDLSTNKTPPATPIITYSPTATVTSQGNWVIFSRERAEALGITSWLVKSDGFWTPAADDVMILENKLAAYLSQNSTLFYHQPPVWERLEAYQRQYFGLERGGTRIIYGNYFCDNGGKDWRLGLVFVMDGGECYFQVEYDVENGAFISLMVNGEA